MKDFLENSEWVDWRNKRILETARMIANGSKNKEEIAKKCFEFVRDEIKHSLDIKTDKVTCKASDVLAERTGFCFAKSHLLAALCRANGIPAGLCYQRTLIDQKNKKFCLHGLNVVYLEKYGWYRVDPRGNKPGICSDFCPPKEQLAFPANNGEQPVYKPILVKPLLSVVKILTEKTTPDEVYRDLPDATESEIVE
ncbi:MAG TPA: transglutaminase-like domain-containing protein [Candidatus Omnitrophota bacterium]|nr:transglutaminase-like domain-containing protein [Candidatus Omnitrophota bacterium]HPS19701.1 transglutaminase-like domain-containing protein [Candidatus Omnitrophota bacterium]